MKSRLLLLALVILVGTALYINTLRNEFVWDDYFLIVDNQHIRGFEFLPRIFTTDLHRFGLERSNFYRPLQTVSFMLDYAVGKLDVRPYHITNLFLHLTAAALVYFIALKLSGEEAVAFLASLIFAAHPVQTEVVTYLSGRADLLAAVFILGGFLSFLYYYSRRSARFFATFNVLFVLGLLSKEISLIFPFLIFAWAAFYADDADRDARPGRRSSRGRTSSRERKTELKPAYFSIATIALIYVLLRLTIFHFRGNFFGLDENEVFHVRFLTMLKALWRYFALLVFPLHLHMERNFPWVRNLADPAVWTGVAVIAGSAILAKRTRRGQKAVSFAVLWFYISLFPVLNIIPVNAIMSEHWLYLPAFSFALILAYAVFRMYQFRSRGLKALLSLILASGFCFYSYRAVARNTEWRDEETLYYATLRHQPGSSRVYYNLGNIYAGRREYERALEKYRVAVKLKPDYAAAWNNMGLANFKLGKTDLAVELYRKAVGCKPDFAVAHNNLGLALDEKGMAEEAASEYEKAVGFDPEYADPHNGLGIYYAKRKEWAKAVFHFNEALRIQSGHPDAVNNLKRAEMLRKIHGG